MKVYEVRRGIGASPEKVWTVLSDPDALRAANTRVQRIDGQFGLNEKIKLYSDVSPRAFSLQVAEFEAPRRMVWKGGMPFGLFTGIREFNLTPIDAGTDFHMKEVFTGLMLPLIWKSVPDLQPAFDKFANGLESASEGGTT
ncbi:MAG: SRPBCC domain-containing protein [Gammaproteobacteria bacterium]|nr:SRPBCC domain-containing protein [Gammaproteobacteria bacterium]